MADQMAETANPVQPVLEQVSPATAAKAENSERNGAVATMDQVSTSLLSQKKRTHSEVKADEDQSHAKRVKGVAPVKAEYLVFPAGKGTEGTARGGVHDDDAAEAGDDRYKKVDARDARDNRQGKGNWKDKKSKGKGGQNTSRSFGSSRDKLQLCNSRAFHNEFSPKDCPFGDKCRLEHDLRKYLEKGKRGDLSTFGGQCPIYEARGSCHLGWKCRFAGSHSEEKELEGGRKELVLVEDAGRKSQFAETGEEGEFGVVNILPKGQRIDLSKRKTKTPKSDAYIEWVNENMDAEREHFDKKDDERHDNAAQYIEPPFRPSEKRRIYYGPETPILAPLTTQGNLPFRRLCVELGAQVTWSEMAMGLPLIQGERSEWALMKAHESEISPPKFESKNTLVQGYDNSRDLKFGAQIAANKPWLATKTVEILTALCPHLRAIDLNCGCPIELVCEKGSGSALLDAPSKLENILRGMNHVSDATPITVKIRMGTKDSMPTANKLIKRLVLGGYEAIESGKGTAGVAAITLHGRSKQQRYTRSADWSYIADCAALINRLKRDKSEVTDTVREADQRDVANDGHVYFVGNGDCYSHVDYFSHLQEAKVDSVMVARGALIKPWIFEEISTGQYLDKSSTERLEYIEKFAKFGLQTWGSDEMGIGTTRRFLLEWLSFSCRYVPTGLLEYLPPNIQDRAPTFKGRNELETLMASENYKDWIKISEMFLGPAHPDFKFEPKHKSNAYDRDNMQAEG
ncbi:tRNA-dihydrouridine synthase-like protein 3 [Amniculicola lignicola CBS 123094]|uniref:tRNA-dihydrouridine(47) synthase [NAD(P)(+)] n=1 Tax=Amniculicola lignicola CBS 123094 TaxID=1392246 RepID=A0A6A5X297_9PLEO|nr:tRNA-dihydrouridine synthase-like protein 3 [Amniculicola lignicola CBS 123094]